MRFHPYWGCSPRKILLHIRCLVETDTARCDTCRETFPVKRMQCHHDTPIRDDLTKKYRPENLMLVCVECHGILEDRW